MQRVRAAWKDAPIENLELLDMILDTAKAQVIAYAPELPNDDNYPSRYVLAQLMQARTLYQAGQVASAGTIGEGEYVFTPRPMDKTVRTIIRPEDGKPDVG
ncbi:hypothetical protein ASF96_10995 [Microbacterium sp. Leaf179]|nr:hypothetical protein ASF96_10995 [Microbacterium sp. Leaf179]